MDTLPHEYTLSDFSETINALPWPPAKVIAAYGKRGDDADWTGGFVVESSDGRIAVIVGWCGTSGWGCQDWTELLCDIDPDSTETWEGIVEKWIMGGVDPHPDAWERDPSDLNRWVAGGMLHGPRQYGCTATPLWRTDYRGMES